MAKRKIETEAVEAPRRSSRRRTDIEEEPVAAPKATSKATPKTTPKTTKPAPKKVEPKAKAAPKAAKAKSKSIAKSETPTEFVESTTPTKSTESAEPASARQYWLLKAEPETRLENGIDVRFSIDDLRSKTEPEPWDGIRNYGARNNLRAMRKGDLAFFYHSNTKVPGIVGTMEIVQEHSPDWSAHDDKTAYYDASSTAANPKWSVVHVEFRSKFKEVISLYDLRAMGAAPGAPLANMQLLKQARLSVGKVSPSEWEHIMSVAKQ
ncbi:at dna binding protein [Ophiostoma piceae UAMH 11346]|uniref:Thymocyte nuclear protein 1 n=1 Tax=Ophiostoma piceae (strain UAMH 11346) TaxID=1262450 RepID=S3BN18_OPHP1|nr:at dna binding protein [Ophiostoma piceae UAMH 11346]